MDMKKLYVEDALEHIDKEVELMGWVHNIRDHKKIVFVDLRDRTGLIQIVGDERFRELSPEDVVSIRGLVKKRPSNLVNEKLKTGTIEMEMKSFTVLSKADPLPFDMAKEKLDVTLPTLLDNRSLTLRHPSVSDIFRVQDAIVEGFRNVSQDLGCVEIFVPTIAASSTEGGAEVFQLQYYDAEATLTQSPQLYKQMLVPVFEKVFTVAHAYRAEPSVTTRHMTESVQMDNEFGFADFNDLLNLLEKVGVEMIRHAENRCKDILKKSGVEPVAFGNVSRLTLREAQEIIHKETGRNITSEKDLSPEDEQDICKWALKNHKSDFIIITHYPTAKRAFYTMPDPRDPEYSLSYDMLFRGLEIASGSQRIHDIGQLEKAIIARGMNPKDFEMYLMSFRYGMPPEGGFSFGLERVTKQVMKLSNVREASLYPRDMERVDIRLSTRKS